jgi:hypothetical protein
LIAQGWIVSLAPLWLLASEGWMDGFGDCEQKMKDGRIRFCDWWLPNLNPADLNTLKIQIPPFFP